MDSRKQIPAQASNHSWTIAGMLNGTNFEDFYMSMNNHTRKCDLSKLICQFTANELMVGNATASRLYG